ncbi:hypothetical protein BHU72_00170 [Desulfuribacillus stibiiarsenatis]|uniref:Flagellar assembly factor FliW n=1 Tax=Desulfuribacillus stibiiarsenatis TaxID=1390249 RepID=A0A1E5L9J6_9FIRM|nr:flagellar assembly protein FliW [Desulfuribacillus stibiiarsenatis]OEH86728.1 hypothetical protein BHU72_00170 [Desulfuribacillus stibiiarsenatis]
MKVLSTRLGALEIAQDQIITFPKGIPGFEEEKGFVLIPAGQDNPFNFLQSIQEADLCFILTEPHLFFNDYEVEISEEIQEVLSIQKAEDVLVYSIVTIKDDLQKATANLQAPVVINMNNKLAKQFILNDQRFTTRQPLFPQNACPQVVSSKEAACTKED